MIQLRRKREKKEEKVLTAAKPLEKLLLLASKAATL